MGFADLGNAAGTKFQVGLEYRSTATSAIASLPPQSLEAMKGLADAFCEDPHPKLVADMYYRVSARERDRLLLEAFKNGQLEKKAGKYVKIDDKPISVTENQ